LKAWTPAIRRHVAMWSDQLRPSGREWWPRYVYHYTDVQNAASILRTGCIYSRAEATRRGLMVNDNASGAVIAQTLSAHQTYVRLYFRPRTPTQYQNEGIRPIQQRYCPDSRFPPAHCPVPVFFCFDAVKILSDDATEFSNGNMGSARADHGSSYEFFQRIPFQEVYHQGSFTQDQRDDIVFHRSAETLVPNALALEPALEMITCRSIAERQTLLHLLPARLRNKWEHKIRLGYEGLFERQWAFIEAVSVVEGKAILKPNPTLHQESPYRLKLIYCEEGALADSTWEGQVDNFTQALSFTISGAQCGELRFFIEDCLAFASNVSFEEIPF
jgi:ssDNA thymidine ADP-ribosyltransferase, DarT